MEKKLDKNAVSNIEQIQEAAHHKAAATNHQSRKLSKLDEADMWDPAGEVEMSS